MYIFCSLERGAYAHNMSLFTFTLLFIHWYELANNTYTAIHWGAVNLLIVNIMGDSYFVVFYIIMTFKLMQCPLLFHTGSVTGLLGDSASSFFVPPPESRPRDPVDRILALSQIPTHSGWTQAPTEVPLYVPSVAPSRQESSGPLPSPPKERSVRKRTRRDANLGGYLQFEKTL